MSKSNLKNINKLNQAKTPYILYTNSTYSNLIYKLQKSVAWSTKPCNWVNYFYSKQTENINFSLYTEEDSIWYSYRLLKEATIFYNPNPFICGNVTNELIFTKKYVYLDIDVLSHLKRLHRQKLKKLRRVSLNKSHSLRKL